MNIDISSLKTQVQMNCNISDARHAGVYSLCGLLLRLRDLYKWENSIPPWQEPPPEVLLEWVESKEALWETLASLEFQPLDLGGRQFDPFDSDAVNGLLRPSGLRYGAGYGVGMKPTFFLALLADTLKVQELTVDIVEHELARDIFAAPAMRQGGQVFARRSPMLFFLWDQIMEMRPSARNALVFALSQYGLEAEPLRRAPRQFDARLREISRSELDVWIHHEIGEARSTAFTGDTWPEIVSSYSNTPVEIYARVIKDLIADTHDEGLFSHIIRNRIRSTLGFYMAWMRPFTRVLFPEAIDAFNRFRDNGDWSGLSAARDFGFARACRNAHALVELHEAGRGREHDRTTRLIIAELIEPLGIFGKENH
ncbi:MAG: Sfum_1244 family protein [Syntrophobacteraceae bacterium]|nr:hypothetical protein [Desulfobacteraceae bacterium]